MGELTNAQGLFRPIESKRSFEEVAEQIKESIIDGKLSSGDRLPSELALAQEFNVGRQTIREALRSLESSGLIKIHRGTRGGAIVEDKVLHVISDTFQLALQMQDISVEDLTVARIEVEKGILQHVISNATSVDLEALQANIDEAREKVKEGEVASSINVEFHRLLAKASGNPVFEVVIDSLMMVATNYLSGANVSLAHSSQAIEEHAELIRAISSRNIEKATEILQAHLYHLGDSC